MIFKQHARHHAATGHMTRDEVFVPKTESQVKNDESFMAKLDDILEDSPLWNFANVILQQLLGWPLYLTINAAGQEHYPKGTNRGFPFNY